MVGTGRPQSRQSTHRTEPDAAAFTPAQRSMGRNWARQAIVAKTQIAIERTSHGKNQRKSRPRRVAAGATVFPVCAYDIGLDRTSIGIFARGLSGRRLDPDRPDIPL